MKEKIVLIGAGSAVFTQGLVADLIRLDWTADVALVDIDPGALDVAYRLAQKMVAATGAAITLRATTDRRAALPGATAVICTVGVGGRRAWEQDVFVPRKYGVYAPVGDTVGPGGSSRALRMIPVMVEIARDVVELCPQALFFNYGNPMAPICRAIRKATGANVTGLCHGVVGVARHLARKLEVPVQQLQYTAVGINHLTWFTSVRANGQDVMGTLRAIAAAKAAETNFRATPNDDPFDTPDDDPFSWRLMHLFGAFPAVLDRHVTEFFPQFFRDGSYWGCTLGVDTFHFEGTIAEGDSTFAEMKALAYDPAPLDPKTIERGEGEHEQVMDIIDSIRRDRNLVFSANLPNTGQVSNLPMQAIVESPCVANAEGLRAVTLGALPSGIVGTLATRYQWVETIVEAALERSRDKFIQALILDGATSSVDQAVALADELLAVQAPYLEGWEIGVRHGAAV
jgi:alpha-galactosidase